MKCPKCGSEVKSFSGKTVPLKVENGVGVGFIPQYVCLNCKINVNDYQQRLDRVLSKFEGEEEYGYNFPLMDETNIDYYNGKFKLYQTFNDINVTISLETVESLLKDLGEFDD